MAMCSRDYGRNSIQLNMSRIVAFYKRENIHPLRYTIEEMWTWEGRRVEATHTFIQWLFPLNVPSGNSIGAPVLTEDDLDQFQTNPELRARLMKSFSMMLKYYGFAFSEDEKRIVKADDFEARSGWLYPSKHNYLRISKLFSACWFGD